MLQSASTGDRPLITIAMRHYNNARFVEAALKSAFAQTYQPLEILFIDDCSTDGGFDLAARLINEYRGPHRVVLFRSKTNVGVWALTSYILQFGRGEIIVYADADDISSPERCEEICLAFAEGGPDLYGVVSYFDHIDASGAAIDNLADGFGASRPCAEIWTADMLAHGLGGPPGAVAAFRREILALRTPFDDLRKSEDLVCGFRSLALGRMATIPKVLVLRRAHDGNVSGPIHPGWTGAQLRSWHDTHLRETMLVPGVMLRDLRHLEAGKRITVERARALSGEVLAFARRLKLLRVAPRLPLHMRFCIYFALHDPRRSFREDIRALLQRVAPSLAMVFLRRNPMIRARKYSNAAYMKKGGPSVV